jgi:outer membrane protein assembly factor BamA
MVAVLVQLASVDVAIAQQTTPEPATRAEVLRAEREEKAQALVPPKPSGLERALLALENDRLLERLLNPAEGFYPKIGNITPGSGFAGGVGYRRPYILGNHVDFSGFGAMSVQGYWMLDARFLLPRLARGRLSVDLFSHASDFPAEHFYGIGPDSQREDETLYQLDNVAIGTSIAYRLTPWLTLGSATEVLTPDVGSSNDRISIEERFDESTAPGLAWQPRFLHTGVTAEVNYRQPRGNPRAGGLYSVGLHRYLDREDGRYTFDRLEVEFQQYISLYRQRRVLALHAFGSFAEEGWGGVPFYLQRTLGGPDDLRGFREFRFRDANQVLFQAEYRWEIFTAVDGAIFYDAGTVASQPGELQLGRLDRDFGIGFRFGTQNGVFLRIEGAFGSRDGKHFILRYGHVF